MFRIRQGLTVTLSYAHPETGADFDDVGVSNGSTARATTPGRPRRVEAAARGANRIDVSWTAPRDNGGRAITGYRVEASPDGASNWTTVQANTGSATSFRRTRASPRGRRGTTASGRSTRKGAGDHSYHYGHLHTYDRREAIAYASATTAGEGRRPLSGGFTVTVTAGRYRSSGCVGARFTAGTRWGWGWCSPSASGRAPR